MTVIVGSFTLSGGGNLGVSSCACSLPDSPIGDTKQNKAFIADRTTNARDLATFDALRGSIDQLHDVRMSWSSDSEKSKVIPVDDLRSLVAEGSWPDASAGYDGTGSAFNPQLWVRLAELSQDEIQRSTGEQWDVIDFAYPFPDNELDPALARRDKNSCVITRLICRSGEDEGLYATVRYWRWEHPARFETDVEEARAYRENMKAYLAHIGALEALHGRRYLLSQNELFPELFVWAQGSDDPLLDPERFASFANAVSVAIDRSIYVTLHVEDAPWKVGYVQLSARFPNEPPTYPMTYEEWQKGLVNGNGALRLTDTSSDCLLSGFGEPSDSHPCTVDDLQGKLAPNRSEDSGDEHHAGRNAQQ